MAKTLTAVDYLAGAEKHPPWPVCVVFGDEAFLRRQSLRKLREAVLGGGDDDFSLSAYEGKSAELRDVLEELATVAMFGGRRLVVVEEADDFISRNRPELEDYVARPSPTGVLALEVASAKVSAAARGCTRRLPPRAWRSTAPPRAVRNWPAGSAAGRSKTTPSNSRWRAAEMLVETIGAELGLIDQELAKMAPMAEKGKISEELVARMVGGWRTRTAWDMLDAALDGKVAEAMLQLDRLLLSGENPVGLLAQISALLRRFAAATRLILQAEASGRRIVLRPPWSRLACGRSSCRRPSGSSAPSAGGGAANSTAGCLEADLDLKGYSQIPPRHILERLIVRLSAPEGT